LSFAYVLGSDILSRKLHLKNLMKNKQAMFSRELPAAVWQSDTSSGSFDFHPSAQKAHAPGAPVALIPACRDLRGAQDHRVMTFSANARCHQNILTRRTKTDTIPTGILCFGQRASRPGGERRSLKTSN
jgi:hypothetical protein